jgi:hypothetical protein
MYNLVLNGNDEFKTKNNKIYNILVVNNKKNEEYMYDIFDKILSKEKKVYMGIDFEFNKVSKTHKDVALMQICLDYDDKDDKNVYIFIINPNNISNKQKLILLLISNNIYKILHGAESLDIPYIFDQLLIEKRYINLFCYNFYDTKFLCDYYNNIKSGTQDEILSCSEKSETLLSRTDDRVISCSIYDLLLEQEIITKEKYDELYKIEEDMGPIYLIKLDINNLSDKVLKYSLYDVLFLPELIKKMLTYDDMYKFTIREFSCLVNKSKRNVESEFNELEKLVNSMNIYYIYYDNNKYKLHDIWMLYYGVIMLFNNEIKLLSNINYFKNSIKILTKLFIYLAISRKFKIYKSKNIIFEKHIIRKYYNWIKVYSSIYELFVHYYNDIYDDIVDWL